MPAPTTSLTIQAAREITTLLNAATAGTFAIKFTAERRYAQVEKVEECTELRVIVVPASWEGDFDSRSSTEDDHQIHIAFHKRLRNPEDLNEIDELMRIPQQVTDYLRGDAAGVSRRKLPCGAHLMKFANEPIFHPDHLRTKQTFTSVLQLTYQKTGVFR